MSVDRAAGGGKMGSSSLNGHRKRCRTNPTSASSASRLASAPGDPFRRHARGSSSDERHRNSRSSGNALRTPPFLRGRADGDRDGSGGKSSLSSNDDFLDDVRFDVERKNMCVPLGSQDTPKRRSGEQNDSVVLQELCSLGSVLAGSLSRGSDAIVNGVADRSDDAGGGNGNNSRGARDDECLGNENLLTRWLSSSGNSNQGVSSELTAREDDDIVGSSSGVMQDANAGAVGGGVTSAGSGGSQIVGDWAKKALRRKKLADAERCRRMRLKLEGEALAAAAAMSAAQCNSSESRGDNGDGSSSRGNEEDPACQTFFSFGGVVARAANPTSRPALTSTPRQDGELNDSKKFQANLRLPEAKSSDAKVTSSPAKSAPAATNNDGSVPKAASRDCGTGGRSIGQGGTEAVVAVDECGDDDEYGDDFDFLTDADLQAMEEEATKASASASQQASQSASTATNQARTDAIVVENYFLKHHATAGGQVDKPGVNTVRTQSVGSISNSSSGSCWRGNPAPASTAGGDGQQMAGSKRPAGSGTRPPLVTVGPNAKRADHRQHYRGGGGQPSEVDKLSFSGAENSTFSPGNESFQGSLGYSRADPARGGTCRKQQPGGCSQREIVHGRGQGASGASAARHTLSVSSANNARRTSPTATVEEDVGSAGSRGGCSGKDDGVGTGNGSKQRALYPQGGSHIVDLTSDASIAEPRVLSDCTDRPAVAYQRAATGHCGTCDGNLFTTYGSVEEFSRATTAGGRGKSAAGVGQSGVLEKGQTRLTDWSHRQHCTTSSDCHPKVQKGGVPHRRGNSQRSSAPISNTFIGSGPIPVEMPIDRGEDAGRASAFVPSLVHRRFLVLEVTYNSSRNGGAREKILMALEQHPAEAPADDGDTNLFDADASLVGTKDTVGAAGCAVSEGDGREGKTGGRRGGGEDGGSGGGGAVVAQQTKICLQGDWYDCEVDPGEVVHVIFPIGAGSAGARATHTKAEEVLESEHVIVDNASGRLLIVQPDILVSPTKVADTVLCNRKAVLQSRLASDASKSKPAVLGNLKHELFETSLLAAAGAARGLEPSETHMQRKPETAMSAVGPDVQAGRRERPSPASVAASSWQSQGRQHQKQQQPQQQHRHRQQQNQKQQSRGPGPDAPENRNLLTSQYMAALVDKIVVAQLEALYGAGLDEDATRRELLAVSGPILAWHSAFLSTTQPPSSNPSPNPNPNPNRTPGCLSKPSNDRAFGPTSIKHSGHSSNLNNSNRIHYIGSNARGQQGLGSNHNGGELGAGGFASLGPDGTPAARLQVQRVLATEDDVWSPVLGLKGIMDAIVEASVEMIVKEGYRQEKSGLRVDRAGGSGGGGGRWGVGESLVMPVEVKTGKRIGEAHSTHRAQVMLYTLLLRVRYGHDASTKGLLVYTSTDALHTELVSPLPAEIRALILARNRHATGMARIGRVSLVGGGEDRIGGEVGGQGGGATLPPVIRRPRECGMCFLNSECMLYHRSAEGGDEESAGLEKGIFDNKVGHLTGAHLAYFSHWDRAIDLEAKIGEQVRATMWQESGRERESRTSKCMSLLVWLGETECEPVATAAPTDSAPTSSRTNSDGRIGDEPGDRRKNNLHNGIGTGIVKNNNNSNKDGQDNGNGKRFKHIFARGWAVPEDLLRKVAGRRRGQETTALDLQFSARDLLRAPSPSTHAAIARNSSDVAINISPAFPMNPSTGVRTDPLPTELEEERPAWAPLDRPKWAKPLKDLSLSVGDMVCVSAEAPPGRSRRFNHGGNGDKKQDRVYRRAGADHVRLLTGNIAAIHEDVVEVWSDKRMRVPRRGGRAKRGDAFSGNARDRMRVGGCHAGSKAGEALDIEDLLGEGGAGGDEGVEGEETIMFRIDKDEWAAGINMMRSNLVRLMVGPSPESEATGDTQDGGDNMGDEKRRRLIVDLDPPRFGRFTGLLGGSSTLIGWAGDRNASARAAGRTASGGANAPNFAKASHCTTAAPGGRAAGTKTEIKSPSPADVERGVGEEWGGVRGRGWGGRSTGQELEEIFRSGLNEDQRSAVRKLVTAKDYALLLGMPGTGKTWTIALAVRVLLARGASVLITSYTHSAVDNLLLKLIEAGVPCLRVGKPASVHPGVRPHCINFEGEAETTAAYSELVASARVVGCTCLGMKHPLFSHRRFDYCIVDEAGQISQPVVLAPLRCANVFVLVGDHYQLPPLVTSAEALEAGMSESLFRRLCEAHPQSLQMLSYQYRMNGDVMALCNDLTYSGHLRCGNAKIEGQRLHLPNPTAIPPPSSSTVPLGRQQAANATGARSSAAWQGKTPPPHSWQDSEQENLTPWLSEVLAPEKRVIFLDTDAISPGDKGTAERQGGWGATRGEVRGRPFEGLEFRAAEGEVERDGGRKGSLVNGVECDLVRLLTWGLDLAGFDLGQAGVISPYRSQVQRLRAELIPSFPTLEINTIDKYQGRDKKVIMVSFVRSNAEGTVGHLLRDWRRLNVALSRAKHKLILIGSLRTLSSCVVLSSLAGILRARRWVYPLPPGAHRTYPLGLANASSGDNMGSTAAAVAANVSQHRGTTGGRECANTLVVGGIYGGGSAPGGGGGTPGFRSFPKVRQAGYSSDSRRGDGRPPVLWHSGEVAGAGVGRRGRGEDRVTGKDAAWVERSVPPRKRRSAD